MFNYLHFISFVLCVKEVEENEKPKPATSSSIVGEVLDLIAQNHLDEVH